MTLFNSRSMRRGLVKRRTGTTALVGGSILLNKGGAGVGSSYPSLDEYHRITGRGLADKIKALMVKPISVKKKSIQFNM